MSLASDSSLLPDVIMQVSTESEQNLPVSCFSRFPFAFADDRQIQNSDSGLSPNALNTLITGGTRVSLSCGLYKQFSQSHNCCC